MHLKRLDISGFKSFGHPVTFKFDEPITAVVGPNGSGKSNVVESIRFALGEQSIKSLRSGNTSDLIFKSGAGGRSLSRASVTLTFDNTDRVFRITSVSDVELSVDFDEITVSREVYTDGTARYLINSVPVRLKDVVELMASVNIGASGHHIISQGEADRLLLMGARERRQILEESLGLKMYHYRIAEANRKLDKSREHLRESSSLRRELEPHLKFLKREVGKIEQSRQVRERLHSVYGAYISFFSYLLSRYEVQIQEHLAGLEVESREFSSEREVLVRRHLGLQESLASSSDQSTDAALSELSEQKSVLTRKLGKAEAVIESIEYRIKSHEREQERKRNQSTSSALPVSISREKCEQFLVRVRNLREEFSLGGELASLLKNVLALCDEFESGWKYSNEEFVLENVPPEWYDELQTVRIEFEGLEQELREVTDRMLVVQRELSNRELSLRDTRGALLDTERRLSQLESELQAIAYKRETLATQSHELQTMRDDYAREKQEYELLVGDFGDIAAGSFNEDFALQSVRDMSNKLQFDRREVERMKIRLEELGVGTGAEMIHEFQQTEERYTFLGKEITDLEASVVNLEGLITELKETLMKDFSVGVQKINEQFNTFFVAMFGGGSAGIELVPLVKRKRRADENIPADEESMEVQDEEGSEATEFGVEIMVHIPKKRAGDLAMLSGGERSLTSIALLFALSQVNPPPFVVLDETDAALDEANSRKYGQLLVSLSQFSQLIVVTHNRETMSHAGALYGVTLGGDSASVLLSIKFEDAVTYAK